MKSHVSQWVRTVPAVFHPNLSSRIHLYFPLSILFFFTSPTLFFPFRSEQYRISLTIDKINSKKAEVLGPHCSSWPASGASQTHTSHQHVSQRLRSCVTQKARAVPELHDGGGPPPSPAARRNLTCRITYTRTSRGVARVCLPLSSLVPRYNSLPAADFHAGFQYTSSRRRVDRQTNMSSL